MKVYLATPMNGRSIEAIKEKIADCASSLAKTDIDFFNSFLEMTANDNSIDGIVKDKNQLKCCVIQQNTLKNVKVSCLLDQRMS